jgi:hypothetical protein
VHLKGQGRHREVVDADKDVVRPMKTRRCTELARLGNASRMKAWPSVANTGCLRVGTIINLAPMSEGLTEEASMSVVSRGVVIRLKRIYNF